MNWALFWNDQASCAIWMAALSRHSASGVLGACVVVAVIDVELGAVRSEDRQRGHLKIQSWDVKSSWHREVQKAVASRAVVSVQREGEGAAD